MAEQLHHARQEADATRQDFAFRLQEAADRYAEQQLRHQEEQQSAQEAAEQGIHVGRVSLKHTCFESIYVMFIVRMHGIWPANCNLTFEVQFDHRGEESYLLPITFQLFLTFAKSFGCKKP